MEVVYDNPKLEKLCTDEVQMMRKRSDIAAKLKLRIKALEVADTVGELNEIDPLGRWHALHENYAGLWAGKLSANDRLLIRPSGHGEPRDATTVTVVEIIDYH